MAAIRIGVIGCGGISGTHLEALASDDLKGADAIVTAYCDVNRDNALEKRAKFGKGDELIATDYLRLLDSGEVDAVLIATPHPFHPEAAIAAFERGFHVVLEKPVAVTVADARHINEAHQKSTAVFTVHFQNRQRPEYQWVKSQIDAGFLGPLHKANIVWNDWYRTQAYYDSGTWRGSWSGEGGGVLMNQCPHNLDIFCWWLGLPERVEAKIWLGRGHDIEVEDEILALLAFEGGGIGIINASTCDHPGPDRWDIIGDSGAIMIDGGEIQALRRNENLADYTKTTPEIWVTPETEEIEVPPRQDDTGATVGIWRNFLATIRGEEEIIMDGEEGAASVELANAIVASGYLGRPVELPLDEALYDEVLAGLRSGDSGAAMTPQRGPNRS